MQAAEEAPENNRERSARAALWFTGELWPELCPAGCTSRAALSSVVGWIDSISSLAFGDGAKKNKCSGLCSSLANSPTLKSQDLRKPLLQLIRLFWQRLSRVWKFQNREPGACRSIRTFGQVICWSAKRISKLVIPWGHDLHRLHELRNSEPHALLRLLPESLGCRQPSFFHRCAQEVGS